MSNPGRGTLRTYKNSNSHLSAGVQIPGDGRSNDAPETLTLSFQRHKSWPLCDLTGHVSTFCDDSLTAHVDVSPLFLPLGLLKATTHPERAASQGFGNRRRRRTFASYI